MTAVIGGIGLCILIFTIPKTLIHSLAVGASPMYKQIFRQLLFFGLWASPSALIANRHAHHCDSVIDYSASNEFIKAHYGTSLLNNKTSYFEKEAKLEPVYNARKIDHALQTHGFQLLHDRNFNLAVQDWTDMCSIRDIYLPHLEQTIRSSFNESIHEIIFWCPSLRTHRREKPDKHLTQHETPRSGYVATAHIDTDVNAYESERALVDIVLKNKVEGTYSSSAERIVDLIMNQGRRFSIVNAWRSIRNSPVATAPLAFMPARYKEANTGFPQGTFDVSSCVWYTFPAMTKHELLLFSQYDRDASYSSDLWHCALVDQVEKANPRASFDVRCFILFHERVPSYRDRLRARFPSRLNRAGSAEFCAEQSRRRQE